ncbi:MAG: PepSY domain-containing protein [Alkalilacustris sp.]
MLLRSLLATAAMAVALPSLVLAGPPADALPLSQILAEIEARDSVAHFEEIEWDDDGYWEIEYRRADGARVEMEVDPVTGAILR